MGFGSSKFGAQGFGSARFLRGSFGGLWTPRDSLSAKLAWWDAMDASTITLNGSNVSAWADKSGNSRNATQGTAALQPRYNATGWNGLPCIQLDGYNSTSGTNQYLNIGGTSFSGVYPTMFMCLQVDADDALGVIGSSRMFVVSLGSIGAGGYSFDIKSDGGWRTAALAKGTRNLFVNDKLAASTRLNGSVLESGLSFFDSHSNASIGYVGALYASKGRIGEIVVMSGSTSAVDVLKVEGYLAHKWGMSANLPSTHPYKSAPPEA